MALVLALLLASSLPGLVLLQGLAITCPDNSTQCTTESTCCEFLGHFGCCPIPNAVCCSDHQHCCPEGFKCIHDVCTRGVNTLADILCPDGEHQCPGEMTCCKSSYSESTYACCPFSDAVCCSDGQHCCPGGTTCDIAQGACLPTTLSRSMTLNPAAERVGDVPCSSTFSCPSGDTCCHVPSGGWGCCPLTDAVCCDDHIHCCPHGSQCGPTGCLGMTPDALNLFHLQRSTQAVQPLNVVVCPGGQYQCPDQTTCCQLSSGAWGCCPAPNAVCCDDHIHCCPHGSQCGPTGCLGMTSDLVHPFFIQSFPAQVAQHLSVVVCPGGQYECPDQTTCCTLPSGSWGCCPLPDAVCCDDHVHCCPNGYTCSSGVCSRANSSALPWMRKDKAKPTLQSLLEN